MPPRHSYWTILIDNAPTAFRSATREELQPTFERLRSKHPSAEMRWFARGRVWASPYEAEQAARAPREQRGPSWRPGGRHKDPREAAQQKRKARNADRRAERFERRQAREQSRPPDAAGGPGRDRPRTSPAPQSQQRFGPKPGQRRDQRPHGSTSSAGPRAPYGSSGAQAKKPYPPRDRSERHGQPRHDERRPVRDGDQRTAAFGQRPPGTGKRFGSDRGPARADSRFDAARKRKDDRRPDGDARTNQGPERRTRPAPTQVPRPWREKPPAPPTGPDRPPRRGDEPRPVPARPEEIVVPHDPPERGTIGGPAGSRLIKRPRRS